MNPAIEVQNISKHYWIDHQPIASTNYVALRDVIAAKLRSFSNRTNGHSSKEEFWALKDISFAIAQGERVGIIGRNGAGKSTLLKLLSRITVPTTGRITMRGRVASLLEVGTGFHPELTGRENIYLNGAVLGMTRAEISRKFSEIVEFAEVERFLDTPVKRYSSGMYVRLAFAVAAHLEPEILIVDEVLAVGDAQFQKKCIGKMKDIGTGGRTVLFVSHDMRAILAMCDTAIVLTRGVASEKQTVDEAVRSYSSDITTTNHLLPVDAGDVIVHSMEVLQDNQFAVECKGEESIQIRIGFELKLDLTLFRVGIYLDGPSGEYVFRSLLADWDASLETMRKGVYSTTLTIPAKLLSKGDYLARLHVTRFGIINYLIHHPVELQFSVRYPQGFNEAHPGERDLRGTIIMPNPWETIELFHKYTPTDEIASALPTSRF